MTTYDLHLLKLIEDIHVSALRILNLLKHETRESFLSISGMDLQDITARRLTIIGEAAAALLKKYPEFCEKNKHIPLRNARGMRNALVHDYNGIQWELVWDTVQNELPKLIESLDDLLNKKHSCNGPAPLYLNGIPLEQVAMFTGLSEEEVRGLRQ